jgi:hypothetical protein
MTDPRILDTLRRIETQVNLQAAEIKLLKEDSKYLKELLREVKKIVTRKYEKKETTQ